MVPMVVRCVPADASPTGRWIGHLTRALSVVAGAALALHGAQEWTDLPTDWVAVPVLGLAVVVLAAFVMALPGRRGTNACPASILFTLVAISAALVAHVFVIDRRVPLLAPLLAAAGTVTVATVAHRRLSRVPELRGRRGIARVAQAAAIVLTLALQLVAWADVVVAPLLAGSFVATFGALALVTFSAGRDRRSPTRARLWSTLAAAASAVALLLALVGDGQDDALMGVALVGVVAVPAALTGLRHAEARGLTFDPRHTPEAPPGANRVERPRDDFDPF